MGAFVYGAQGAGLLIKGSSRKVFIRDLVVIVVIPECRSRESVVCRSLFYHDGSPTKFLGDDGNKYCFYCCHFVGLQHYKKSVAPLVKRGKKISRPQDLL